MGGWQLKRSLGGEVDGDEVVYKFHSNTQVKAGTTITIWSASTNHAHEPPTHHTMKGQNWLAGSAVRTELINGAGEEIAWRTTTQTVTPVTAASGSGSQKRKGEAGCSLM